MQTALMVIALILALALPAIPAQAQHMNDPGSPCRDKVVTLEVAQCFSRAYHSADAALNQRYAAVRKVLQPNEQAALLDAEKAWIQYRDAECKAEGELYAGGTARQPVEMACLAFLTRERFNALGSGFGWRLAK